MKKLVLVLVFALTSLMVGCAKNKHLGDNYVSVQLITWNNESVFLIKPNNYSTVFASSVVSRSAFTSHDNEVWWIVYDNPDENAKPGEYYKYASRKKVPVYSLILDVSETSFFYVEAKLIKIKLSNIEKP